MCVCVGLVMLRNVIIGLPEPGTTGVQKHVISYVHCENVYLIFNNAINLNKGKKQTYLKQLKDVYKMSRALLYSGQKSHISH